MKLTMRVAPLDLMPDKHVRNKCRRGTPPKNDAMLPTPRHQSWLAPAGPRHSARHGAPPADPHRPQRGNQWQQRIRVAQQTKVAPVEGEIAAVRG